MGTVNVRSGHWRALLVHHIQWLIKLVAQTRGARAKIARDYAHHHFQKHHDWPTGFERKGDFLHRVIDRYGPTRVFRRPVNMWSRFEDLSEQLAVQACLLEFGEKIRGGG